MTDIRIDDHFWQGDGEAVLTAWYFDDGDMVEAGDVLAEIMLEKTQMEIEAPQGGVLRHRKTVEEAIKKGDLIAIIESIS